MLDVVSMLLSDLSGAHDGSVRLWEWGHNQNIAVARQPGSFPKVTCVLFNAQGNKVQYDTDSFSSRSTSV